MTFDAPVTLTTASIYFGGVFLCGVMLARAFYCERVAALKRKLEIYRLANGHPALTHVAGPFWRER